MRYIPIILLAIAQISQTPSPPGPNPNDLSDQETGSGAADSNEFDASIREIAERIDQIPYVSAKLRQTIRSESHLINSTGTYKIGPGYRCYFELQVDLTGTVGKLLYICDGEVGYRYEKLSDEKVVQRFAMDRIGPLLEQKKIPAETRRLLMSQPPFVRPGDMLRGHLETVTFTKRETGTLGENHSRRVAVFEGHWKKTQLAAIAGDSRVQDVEDLSGSMPQYVRLYLDEKTGWPVRIELFRKDGKEDRTPIFVLEFLKLEFPQRIPDEEFRFTPPVPEEQIEDITDRVVEQLKILPDKRVEGGRGKAEGGRRKTEGG